MTKMIIANSIILTRVSAEKDGKAERLHLTPALKGKPAKTFDFTADEITSISKANPNALRSLEGTNEILAPKGIDVSKDDATGGAAGKTEGGAGGDNKSQAKANELPSKAADEDKL